MCWWFHSDPSHMCSSRPLPLELTAVGETVVMENLEIFRMNGFQFQIDMEGKPEGDLIPGWIERDKEASVFKTVHPKFSV